MKTNSHYEIKSSRYSINAGRMRHILDLMPDKQSKILDIGCAGGELARILKERGHHVLGADISAQALEVAAPHLEEGFAFDVADECWPEKLLAMRFDVIVASEIIEHLFEPELFIKNLHKILAPNGRVIVTTPNFLFWKNRFRMLFGRFQYEKMGILDFGHIRFFTLETTRQTFCDAGFQITREHHYYPNLEHRALGHFGRYLPGFFAYQLIFQLMSKNDTLVGANA